MGPPVFKTGGAALGVARWVRLPRAPATERPMSACHRRRPPGPRPPSVERVLAAVARPRWATTREAARVLAVTARRWSTTSASGSGRWRGATRPGRAGREVVARLRRLAGRSSAPRRRHQRDRRHRPYQPRPGAVAGGRRRRPRRSPPDYLLLELDRETGRRGARARVAEEHLVALTGAEDALVTNNNAAALALAVGLAGSGGVVVVARRARRDRRRRADPGDRPSRRRPAHRGRDDEPDARRRTSRRRSRTAERASSCGSIRRTSRCHGFIETPDPAAVAELAHRHGAIVIDDLGSGALLDTAAFGLAHEPMPRERLAAGADLVTFSGDKLVGGPQAGLIVGRADLVARMRRDPLARAMRPDKVDAGRCRGDARAVPGRARRRARSRSGGCSRRRSPSFGARGRALSAAARRTASRSSSCARRSAVARCPARRCRRSGWRSRARSATGSLHRAARDDAAGHRPDRGRSGRARPADRRRRIGTTTLAAAVERALAAVGR